MSSRLETAVDFLLEGTSPPFKIGDLRIGLKEDKTLYVTGWTRSSSIENMTKNRAIGELEEIKQIFEKMIASSDRLHRLVQESGVEFNLAFDYGMGAIGICTERKNTIEWLIEMR